MRLILRVIRVTEVLAAFIIVVTAIYLALRWLKAKTR